MFYDDQGFDRVKILTSTVIAAAALFCSGSVSAYNFGSYDYNQLIQEMMSCSYQTDADIEAGAKAIADKQCSSSSCTSYGYIYTLCGNFSDVTCTSCAAE